MKEKKRLENKKNNRTMRRSTGSLTLSVNSALALIETTHVPLVAVEGEDSEHT